MLVESSEKDKHETSDYKNIWVVLWWKTYMSYVELAKSKVRKFPQGHDL